MVYQSFVKMLALHVFQYFLLILLPTYTSAKTIGNCNFYQNMTLGQKYNIRNPGYPDSLNYTSCFWTVRSPPKSVIVAKCRKVDFPQSADCNRGKLFFLPMENPDFASIQTYCGNTSFTIDTQSNYLVIGFVAAQNESRFLCSVSAMQDSCPCGVHHKTKIVKDQNASVNEYPFLAVVFESNLTDAFCGASIISKYYALTTAFCLRDRQASNLGLLVGDHDLSTDIDTEYSARYKIANYTMHFQFEEDTLINNIGILQTEKPIVFSFYVGPICLPFRYTSFDFSGQTGTALTWKLLNNGGSKSDVLHKVDLSIVDTNVCKSTMLTPVTDHQICTFSPNKRSCVSDPGSPIIWKDDERGRLQLIGIVSYQMDCATNEPTTNTRVTSYLPWILFETTDAVFCRK